MWTVAVAVLIVKGFVPIMSQVVWSSRPVDVVAFEGQTITLTCRINYPLTTGDSHHWVRLEPGRQHDQRREQSFLSEGKYITTTLSPSRRRRYSVTGQASLGGYTLRVNYATAGDSGFYGCLVYSQNVNKRTLSTFATVSVVPRALPTGTPTCNVDPPHPQPGSLVQFSCYSMVQGSVTSLAWSLGGIPISATTIRAADKSILTFRRTLGDMDNQAVYTCTEQWQAVGSKLASCSIVPFDMPINVSVSPIKEQAVAGESAMFTCNAESVPPATNYTWYYEGHPVSERPDLFLLLAGGTQMKIRRVLGEDFSKYTVRCTVTNALAMRRSAAAFLDLIPASQRDAALKQARNPKLVPNTTDDGSLQKQAPDGMHGNYTLVTVLIALTASVVTAILLVMAMAVISCIRRPLRLKRKMSCQDGGSSSDQVPLHEISYPMRDFPTGSPSSRKRNATRQRPQSFSAYQPLHRDPNLSKDRQSRPRRKVSSPAVPSMNQVKSVSLYENAVSLRLSLSDMYGIKKGNNLSPSCG